MGLGFSSVTPHLPCKCKVLSSILGTKKRKKDRKENMKKRVRNAFGEMFHLKSGFLRSLLAFFSSLCPTPPHNFCKSSK